MRRPLRVNTTDTARPSCAPTRSTRPSAPRRSTRRTVPEWVRPRTELNCVTEPPSRNSCKAASAAGADGPSAAIASTDAFIRSATTRLNAPRALAACWRLDRVRDTILGYMYESHTVHEGARRVDGGVFDAEHRPRGPSEAGPVLCGRARLGGHLQRRQLRDGRRQRHQDRLRQGRGIPACAVA